MGSTLNLEKGAGALQIDSKASEMEGAKDGVVGGRDVRTWAGQGGACWASGKGWRERPAFALSAPTHRVPSRPPVSRAWSLTAVVFPMPWTWICEWPPFPITTTTGTRSDLERGAPEGCNGKGREAVGGVPTLSSVGLGAGTQMGRGSEWGGWSARSCRMETFSEHEGLAGGGVSAALILHVVFDVMKGRGWKTLGPTCHLHELWP